MAKLKTIRAGLGITTVIGGDYIKPSAEVELELEGNETREQVQKVWEDAWNAVSREVSKIIVEYGELKK